MNKIILTGNLTRDPELRNTQTGKTWLRAGIAVQRGFKRDEVDFFELVAWEKTAEFIAKYFVKGSRIFVIGRLQNNNYTDNNGVKHYGVDVIVENVEFGGGKRNDSEFVNTPSSNFDDDEDFIGDEIPDHKVPF